MKKLLLLLSLLLPTLLLSSTPACVHTVQVPVLVPQTPCPLPDFPKPPELHAVAVGDTVTLPIPEVVALGLYIGEVQRWMTLAQVCLDAREAPNA
jgi:hypothetical protein